MSIEASQTAGAPRGHALRGYLYIAAAAFLWGVSATLGRATFSGRLFGGGQALPAIDPLILSQTRTTISFLVLLPVLILRGWLPRLRISRRDVVRIALLGILGTAASNYFYYVAIQRTNVATAIVVQYTAPVWVLLYAVARRLQKLTLQRAAAVALATTGIPLLIGLIGSGEFHSDTIGLAAALLAAFAFAFYNIGGHDLVVVHNRWTVLLYVLGSASVFWAIINPPWKVAAQHYSGKQWLFLFVFAVVSALGPFACYLSGLQFLEPTRAIIVSCLEPVFTISIAAIALGELLRPVQMAGIALVLFAVVVVQWPSGKTGDPALVIEPIE